MLSSREDLIFIMRAQIKRPGARIFSIFRDRIFEPRTCLTRKTEKKTINKKDKNVTYAWDNYIRDLSFNIYRKKKKQFWIDFEKNTNLDYFDEFEARFCNNFEHQGKSTVFFMQVLFFFEKVVI